MAITGTGPRWIPNNEMIVDPLTKVVSQCNMVPLLECMKSGKLRICSVHDEMSYKKEIKGLGQTIARLKGMTTSKRKAKASSSSKSSDEAKQENS